MVEHDDEEALRWAGEDLSAERAVRPSRSKTPSHEHAVEATTEADAIIDFDEDDEAAVVSSTALVTMGVLGGVYFLYTLGWLTYALRSITHSSDVLAGFMFNLGLWLSVLAAPLWFALTFWFTRRLSIRYAWLVLGALVLIPIPLVWPR